MILSQTTYSDYSGEKSFPKSTYTGALYRVEDAGSGIGEINPYPTVARKTAAFCLKKKPPKTYIHKFKHYFSFNKYEETRIYTSRAGSSFYNVKMTDFNDNMGEQIFKSKKPWEVTSF